MFGIRTRAIAIPAALLLVSLCSTSAGAASVSSTANSGIVASGGQTAAGGNASGVRRIGTNNGGTNEFAAIYFFELPAEFGTGPIDTASLSVTLDSTHGALSFNVDLYGLGFVAADTLDAGWFYEGAAADATTSATYGTGAGANLVTRIEENLMTAATATGTVGTSNEAALIAFLDALDGAGAGPGDFAVFRLNPDAETDGLLKVGYNVGFEGPSAPALLDLVVVPVPPAAWLFAPAIAMLGLRRRGD